MDKRFSQSELCQAIADETGVSFAASKKVMNEAIRFIGDAISRGDSIQFLGFGTFERRYLAKRRHVSPITGKDIEIEGRHRPFFRASPGLKAQVKNGGGA